MVEHKRASSRNKGHRLRLDLADGDSNALDFGGHNSYGLKVGKDTISFDKDHASHLILPVIPPKLAERARTSAGAPRPREGSGGGETVAYSEKIHMSILKRGEWF